MFRVEGHYLWDLVQGICGICAGTYAVQNSINDWEKGTQGEVTVMADAKSLALQSVSHHVLPSAQAVK